ncbi:hypothetical protein P171DRAFT_135812, partial [Karstenula rhodostoma CBS 690.94]
GTVKRLTCFASAPALNAKHTRCCNNVRLRTTALPLPLPLPLVSHSPTTRNSTSHPRGPDGSCILHPPSISDLRCAGQKGLPRKHPRLSTTQKQYATLFLRPPHTLRRLLQLPRSERQANPARTPSTAHPSRQRQRQCQRGSVSLAPRPPASPSGRLVA